MVEAFALALDGVVCEQQPGGCVIFKTQLTIF